ncbi:MAG: AI-2 transport protein TqsA [Desulforhopalus sp.]|jgi:AI-2 transport protein TqsA
MEIPQVRKSNLIQLAAFVVVVAGMKAASSLVVPFLLAVFLAIICTPLLFWLQRKGVPELIGLLIILAAVIGISILLALVVGSSLSSFSNNLPTYQDRLAVMTADVWRLLSTYGVTLDTTVLQDILNPGKLMKLVAGTLNGLGGILTNAFLILLTFIFLLLEAAGIPDKIKAIHGGADLSLSDYEAITEGVNRYLGIKSVTSLITAGIVYFILSIQGVDFPVLWALLAFLFNFIPNIGSIIAAIPPVLLSLIQFGFGSALFTALGFLVVNILIGSILEPRIMGKGIGLSVLVVFISLSFWGWVLGPVGMLLSVPLTMTVKIVLSGNESTRWLALLLGSNRDVALYLAQCKNDNDQIV